MPEPRDDTPDFDDLDLPEGEELDLGTASPSSGPPGEKPEPEAGDETSPVEPAESAEELALPDGDFVEPVSPEGEAAEGETSLPPVGPDEGDAGPTGTAVLPKDVDPFELSSEGEEEEAEEPKKGKKKRKRKRKPKREKAKKEEAEEEAEEERPGFLQRLATASPYVVLLGISVIALLGAVLILLGEILRYEGKIKPTQAAAPQAVEADPPEGSIFS
ncbi:MAG: hypothetical protein ACYTG0_11465 [Planctomycetota bacterium]